MKKLRILPLISLIFSSFSCATQPKMASAEEEEIAVEQHTITQKRLDTFRVSRHKKSTRSCLQATIFLHGAGQSADNLIPKFSPPPGALFVFPEAPYPATDLPPGVPVGYLHWPRKPWMPKDTLPIILQALELQSQHLTAIMETIKERYSCQEPVNIVGISQGGIQAYHLLLHYPQQIGKVVFAFAPVLGPNLKSSEDAYLALPASTRQKQSILLVHHRDDRSVDFKHSVYLSEFFQRAGVTHQEFFGDKGGHSLTTEDLLKIRNFLGADLN